MTSPGGTANVADRGLVGGKVLDFGRLGEEAYSLVSELYPICRSITGDGLRQTLRILQRYIPLEIHEVPTGTKAFDWEIPKEWAIKDAYILDQHGKKIVDFRQSNLHVVNYSAPVDGVFSLSELMPHLHSLPEHPEWIPYRTTYYNEDWGFCVSHRQLKSLEDGNYNAVIDSRLFPGSLSYGETYWPGESEEEILFFAHCCHPSLCNDNLSGIAMLAVLGRELANASLRHSVRFVFAPATIGSIAWLSANESHLCNIKAGLVASVLGDSGKFRYKLTRDGNTLTDRACLNVLRHSNYEHEIIDFSPWGYDERQFGSPGINLPVGRLTRSPNGEYPEYHTSADDLSLVRPEFLAESMSLYYTFIDCIERNFTYRNTHPNCEPQLGRRNLYRKLGGYQSLEDSKLAMLWMLNQSDGNNSVLDIAARSGMSHKLLADAADLLVSSDLLEVV